MLTQPDVPRGTIQPLHVPNGVGVVDMQGGTLGAIAQQAPSMQRIMAQNPDLIPAPPKPKTPAAAAALAARQNLINGAGNEKPEEGRRAPRKI